VSFGPTVAKVTLCYPPRDYAGTTPLSQETQSAHARLANAAAAEPIRFVEKPGQLARYACTTRSGWMMSAPAADDLSGMCDSVPDNS